MKEILVPRRGANVRNSYILLVRGNIGMEKVAELFHPEVVLEVDPI